MIQSYYEEIDLSKQDRLLSSLNKIIDAIGYDKSKVYNTLYRKDLTKEEALERVSEGALAELEKLGDRQVATKDCNVLKFTNVKFTGVDNMIAQILASKAKRFGLSGRTWYPVNGYMGWHTNSNNKGFRLYCSYAREVGKSFFRYKNPENQKIITSWDKEGWNFRIFKIGAQPLWHSVYSETDRFSVGYAAYTD